MERMASIAYDSVSFSPPRERAAEMQEEKPYNAPVHEQGQGGWTLATGSREEAGASSAVDAQAGHKIIDGARSNREPDGVPDEDSNGSMKSTLELWPTAFSQPQEPTRATPLFLKIGSELLVDSDVCRLVGDQSNSTSSTELGPRAAKEFASYELSKGRTAMVNEMDDEHIGSADWLDVTHAMLNTDTQRPRTGLGVN